MGYLFAAYTIIFLALFLYLVFIWRRQVALESDVSSVKARINEITGAGALLSPSRLAPPESEQRSSGGSEATG